LTEVIAGLSRPLELDQTTDNTTKLDKRSETSTVETWRHSRCLEVVRGGRGGRQDSMTMHLQIVV
jgi:hypothetical protein